MTGSSLFVNFYMDDSLPGHLLLEPSIAVAKGYGRIFSSLDKCCDPFLELIYRLVLFIILPLGALLCAFFIPIGLLCKVGYKIYEYLFPEDKGPPQETDVNPHRNGNLVSEEERSVKKTPQKVFPEDNGPSQETDVNPHRNESLASEKKHSVEKAPQKVNSIGKKKLASMVPKQRNPSKTGSIRKENLAPGESYVAEDGNCVFSSFLHFFPNIKSTVREERKATVRWMRENYNKDSSLRDNLTLSMAEHFEAKEKKLEEDQASIKTKEKLSVNLEEQEREYIKNEKKEAEKNLSETKTYLKDLTNAEPTLTYFNDISKEDQFVGYAELYALSQRYNVTIEIYSKDPKKNTIISKPVFLFKGPGKSTKTIRLTKTSNHYNPYKPPKN